MNTFKRNKTNDNMECFGITDELELTSAVLGSSDNFSDNKDRIYYLTEYVYAETVQGIIKAIHSINKNDDYQSKIYALDGHVYNRKPITIYVNSYGGSVYDGLALIGAMETSTTPIITVANGKVMSMGVIIALAGHIRKATPYTTYMIHSVSSFTWGQVKQMEEDVKEAKRLNNVLFDFILSNSAISKKKLTKIYKSKQDYFFDAKTAKQYDMIEEIV